MSGGYSGQVSVYGLPSGRLLKLIPVFSQFAEDAYGYDAESKPLLETTYGFIPWDDSHHPELSMTDGVPDGRWLFINANNTPRIARIDLTRFETDEIIQIPNSAGGHASPFTTPNTKYVVSATRFSVPIPEYRRPDRHVQEELQGHAVVHHGRPAGEDGHRVPDPDARLQLRPRATPARVHPTAGSSSPSYNSEQGEHQARRERVAERQGLHRRR
jgi:nitrous-oxide reductase